jgi:hypothetical protein
MADKQEVEAIAKDDDGSRKRIIVDTPSGLPKRIVKTPKKINTNRKNKKGSKGKPMNLNGKDYGKKDDKKINDSEISKDLNKDCGGDKDKKKRMVRTPKK